LLEATKPFENINNVVKKNETIKLPLTNLNMAKVKRQKEIEIKNINILDIKNNLFKFSSTLLDSINCLKVDTSKKLNK
jgi:hypothetical protein